jgi:hypothetical protein
VIDARPYSFERHLDHIAVFHPQLGLASHANSLRHERKLACSSADGVQDGDEYDRLTFR